ncbi:hypothetical protein RJ640_022744 [Escallonia rubra]|uniref:Uncharacterized protein n=1 Tax=Escallonia rubra TaxID=112253 RepID=A0AA88QPS8_9ASTE|nr:hypothetical protein RJ640_022744 [Escallonia rubra]
MVTLKYSGSNGVREHILRMNDMASQLKGLDMEIFEGFLVHFIMTSLPAQFGPFKFNYNTQKEKWKMSELISMCVQEEERLKSEQHDNAHVAITSPSKGKGKGKGKKFGKGNVQGNKNAYVTSTVKLSASSTKGSSGPRCHFCKDKGHMRKECHKFREWLEKKVDTVYVPSMTRNLISVSRLDAYGYSFKFENKGFSLFLYPRVTGSGLLEGNLYKLLLNASFTESLKTMNVNDVVAKTCDAEYSGSCTPRIINLEEIQDLVSIPVIQKVGAPLSHREDNDAPKGDKFSLLQCPRNQLEQDEMERIPYASAVGSLMYAQVCTRPDIAYVVGMLGRYQINPGMGHWKAAKKVMRYLQGTKDFMLTYRKSDNLEVIGYSDSDYAGCVDTLKSTSGYVFMLTEGSISWKSVK